MGCGNSKPKAHPSWKAEGFTNGRPGESFQYDEKKKCTERENGLLFRLSNSTTKQWAFYNDSKMYAFHVTVTFSPECRITPMGKTTLVALPNNEGYIAKVIVYPCDTETFIEGEIDGFDAVYQAFVVSDIDKKSKQATGKASSAPLKT